MSPIASEPTRCAQATLLQLEALARLVQDALALALGERRKCLVFEPQHAPPLIVVAHPAFEADIAAAVRSLQ